MLKTPPVASKLRLIFFAVGCLFACVEATPVLTQPVPTVAFTYVPLEETETQGVYRRREIVLSAADSPDSFAKGPEVRSYRLRFISSSEPQDAGRLHRVVQSLQQQRTGRNTTWENQVFTWLPTDGAYRETPDKEIVPLDSDGSERPLDNPDDLAKLNDFFLSPTLSGRMGRFLDGRRIVVGDVLRPDVDLAKAIIEMDVPITLFLSEVGPRWGRNVARFEATFSSQGPNAVIGHWTIDVDVRTARAIRAASTLKTAELSARTNANGHHFWQHFTVFDEIQYNHSSIPLDRSAFDLVNPSFLKPGAGKVRDIAFLPQSESLVLLEDVAGSEQTQKRQRLGLWNLQTQSVSQVEGVAGASRAFASENANHVLLADTDLSLNSYILRGQGFTPFSSFLRYPDDETFTTWDTLGVYSVAGTTRGRLVFVNTGWDQEFGAFQISSGEISGVSVVLDELEVATLDVNGYLHLHDILLTKDCEQATPLSAFCDGIEVELALQGTFANVAPKACARSVGASLRLIPGRNAVAFAYGPLSGDCQVSGKVEIRDLTTGAVTQIPGDSFAVDQNGTRLVTNLGSHDLDAPKEPSVRFTPVLGNATRVALADEQDVAFVLSDAGAVHVVDLATGTVVDDLTQRRGFTSPASVLARALWLQRFAAVMVDGTVLIEHPETGRQRILNLTDLDGAAANGPVIEAALIAQENRLLVVFSQPGQQAFQLALTVAAIDENGEATVIYQGATPNAPLSDHFSGTGAAFSVLEQDPFTKALLALTQFDQREPAQTNTPAPPMMLRPLNWVAGRGDLSGEALFLTQGLDFKSQRFGTIVQIGADIFSTLTLPGQDYFLDNQKYFPMALGPSGRRLAIANLPPPTDGNWNANGQVVLIVDTKTGARVAEFFQDWADATAMTLSPDENLLAVGYDTGNLSILDLKRGIHINTFIAHSGGVTDLIWDTDRLHSRGEDGVLRIWDPRQQDLDTRFRELADKVLGGAVGLPGNETLIATILDPLWDQQTQAVEGTVAITSDGYYAGDKNSLRHFRFITGAGRAVDLSEADLLRNRPDIVFGRTGMISPAREELLSDLHAKRLLENKLENPSTAALALNARPEIVVTRDGNAIKTLPKARFSVAQSGYKSPDIALFISNNGVRISEVSLGVAAHEVAVDLTPGLNRITFETRTAEGQFATLHRETMRFQPPAAPEAPRAFVFAAGVSQYENQDLNLAYAAKDANDLAAYFAASSGAIVQVATDAAATRDIVAQARSFFAQARPQDRTLFFFAGHGLLDDNLAFFLGSHETRSGALAQSAIAFSEIEAVFDDTASLHRVILLDACHSGAVDPETQSASLSGGGIGDVVIRDVRGAFDLMASPEKPVSTNDSYEALRANFLDTRSRSGAHIIAASGGLQFAYERGNVANGLFTHAILSGLKSRAPDTNGDDAINLDELFRYVVKEVSRLSNGRQVPSVRSEPLFGGFAIN